MRRSQAPRSSGTLRSGLVGVGCLHLLLGCASAGAFAQGAETPAELVTDRPDQTESAVTVPDGSLQVEVGVQLERDQASGRSSVRFEAPGTLLRWGLSERFELRLAWPGAIWSEITSNAAGERRRDRSRGVTDPEVGAKLGWLARGNGDRLDLALLGHLTLPAGDDELGSPRADPSLRICASLPVNDRVDVGLNLGWETASTARPSGGQTTATRWIYTVAAGFDLSPRWGAFVELFGDLPASDPTPAAHSLDAGLTLLLSPRLQLDLVAGRGWSRAAPDRFVGLGISVRIPQ